MKIVVRILLVSSALCLYAACVAGKPFCPVDWTSAPESICRYYMDQYVKDPDVCGMFRNQSGCLRFIKGLIIKNCDNTNPKIAKKLKTIEEMEEDMLQKDHCSKDSTFKITDESSYSLVLKYIVEGEDDMQDLYNFAKFNVTTKTAVYPKKLCNAYVHGVMGMVAPNFDLKKQSNESIDYINFVKKAYVMDFHDYKCKNLTGKTLKENLLEKRTSSSIQGRVDVETILNDVTLGD